jgi:hypothetical protein
LRDRALADKIEARMNLRPHEFVDFSVRLNAGYSGR